LEAVGKDVLQLAIEELAANVPAANCQAAEVAMVDPWRTKGRQ
jgi:hypothetical protein